jgi:hypothetical protein
MIVLGHGVADYELDACRDGYELKFQRAAIEQKGMSCLSQAGDELVHDSDASANKTVFGLAAELGDLG